MFFAIAEPNRPVTEWITAFGCATKKKKCGFVMF
jgi:hypothetical protein